MFITFHKQVSVIKAYDHPEHSSFLTPSRSSLLLPQPLISAFLLLSTKSCDILCIFKQLIRVHLCFYSRDFGYCCRRCCCCSRCCYLRKSFYQKRPFFVTMKKNDTICATHNAPLCPIITRERKRRSWANFRGRYITRKLIFLACVLDLGLANDICIYRN